MNVKKLIVPLFFTVPLLFGASGHAQQPEQLEQMRQFLSLMEDYYRIIDSVHAVAVLPEIP